MKRILTAGAVLLGFGLMPAAWANTVYDTSLANPGVYFGTGNANTNYTVATDNNLELGLAANLRFIGQIDPGNSNTYVAPAGTTGCCANWDFEFSINTQAGGGTDTLEDYTYTLTIEDDNTSASNTFDPTADIPDDSYYGPSGETTGIGNLSTADYGAQNAENLSFPGFLSGFDPNASDTYTITLDAYQGGNTPVDSVSINVAAATPEPAALLLCGIGLALLVTFRFRRRIPLGF